MTANVIHLQLRAVQVRQHGSILFSAISIIFSRCCFEVLPRAAETAEILLLQGINAGYIRTEVLSCLIQDKGVVNTYTNRAAAFAPYFNSRWQPLAPNIAEALL